MSSSSTCVVTGATGFVANELIVQLLSSGYTVRGTVRSPGSLQRVMHLRDLAAAMGAALSVFPLDMLQPGSLDDVIKGARYVFHVASPVIIAADDPQSMVADPAVEGTRNMLEAVNKAGTVERVVLTSSVAAVESITRTVKPLNGQYITHEDHCTDATLKEWPYQYSKVKAEELAWDLAAKHNIDLVTIHPSLILGTLYCPDHPTFSVEQMQQLVEGRGDLAVGYLIDVADVAKAHILAAITPGAQGRYLLSLEYTCPPQEVAAILSAALPEFKFQARTPAESVRYCDNSKTCKDLGMQLSPPSVFLPAMARCMIRLGVAKPVEQ